MFYIRQKTFSCEKRPGGHTVLEGYIQNITDIQQRRNDITLLTHAINNATEDIFAAHEDGTLIFANRFFRQHHNIGLTDDITQLKIYQVNSHARSEEEWNRIKASIPKGSQRKGFIFYDPLPLHPEVLAMEGNAKRRRRIQPVGVRKRHHAAHQGRATDQTVQPSDGQDH